MNRVFEWIKKYSKILFVFYMGTVIWVLVLKFPTGLVTGMFRKWMNGEDVVRMSPQWMPFKTIISYVRQVQSVKDWFFKNLACNIIMFVPYGFLTPYG